MGVYPFRLPAGGPSKIRSGTILACPRRCALPAGVPLGSASGAPRVSPRVPCVRTSGAPGYNLLRETQSPAQGILGRVVGGAVVDTATRSHRIDSKGFNGCLGVIIGVW